MEILYKIGGSNYDNEYALLFSAIVHFIGFGSEERKLQKAMNLCERIALDWENPVGQYLIGCMCFEGEGVPEDKTSGVRWISLAAKSGWPYAIARMGEIYSFDAPVKADHKKAITWFDKVAKNDDNEAELIKDETFYLFGNKNFEVDFTHENPETMKSTQNSLNQGLISPFKSIRDIDKDKLPHFDDYRRALIWNLLTKKKSSGVVASQIGLSKIYTRRGFNVPYNLHTALHWKKMAGKNGHEASCVALGLIYRGTTGFKQNNTEAMTWFKKSVALGGTLSLYHIGLMYYKSLGVERDVKLALKYFQLRTDCEEDVDAFFYMGEIHQEGEQGIPQNSKLACKFYEKAFQLGDPTAAIRIAANHCKGLGMKKDTTKTTEWLKKAASNGCPTAVYLLSLIATAGFEEAEPFILAALNQICLGSHVKRNNK
ncbi:hypothetical protein BD770DRAFT_463759 [Pilaira anomala]|nr:hypothetical protein BD770DRAFT_463759 [Pilaira anomala]